MNQHEKNDLDNYITGHYGEDQFKPDYDTRDKDGLDEPAVLEGKFTSAKAALDFILAGNAYFTLRSLKTGTRYTYRVNQAKNYETRWGRHHFVKLLTGPQNTSDYQYIGMVKDRRFELTQASKLDAGSGPVLAIRWTLEALSTGVLPGTLEIWHEGRCGRCGRMLTVPESVAAGLGPECAGR